MASSNSKAAQNPSIWGERYTTVYLRFPGLAGREMRNHLDSIYVWQILKNQPFFHPKTGSEMAVRHARNMLRGGEAIEAEYEKKMMQIGIRHLFHITKFNIMLSCCICYVRKGGRAGENIAAPSTDDPSTWIFLTVSGATLLRTFYRCKKKQPSNPQLVATETQGIDSMQLLHLETPTDVLDYYRDELNEECGEGVRTSTIQEYEITPMVDSEWAKQRVELISEVLAQHKRKDCQADPDTEDTTARGEKERDQKNAQAKKRSFVGEETAKGLLIKKQFPNRFNGQFATFQRCKSSRANMVSRGHIHSVKFKIHFCLVVPQLLLSLLQAFSAATFSGVWTT